MAQQSQFERDYSELLKILRSTLTVLIQHRRTAAFAEKLAVSRQVLYRFCQSGTSLGSRKIGDLYVIFVEEGVLLRTDSLDRAAKALGSPLAASIQLPGTHARKNPIKFSNN